jgi:type II secretory pathway pseudopilin PulG
MKSRDRNFRAAFIAFDVVMGIAILGIAAAVLISAVSSGNRAARQLASSRQAERAAEAALDSLQAGLPPPKSTATIRIEPCTGGASIPGHHWVQVIAAVDGQNGLLVGLIPDTPPTGGGK